MKTLKTEFADTPHKRERGLMYRKSLPKDSGMLFSFDKPQKLSFWMANTSIPLQIAFVSPDGKIGQIERMSPFRRSAVASNANYQYAIEVNDGWFDKNGIVVGAQVALPQQAPQPQGPPPEVLIQQSYEELLKEAEAIGIPRLTVSYQSVNGHKLPNKSIQPPFEFKTSEDGEPYVIVWDEQIGRFSSLRLENILGVFDPQGNPVRNAQQLRQVAKQAPLTPEDERLVKGIMPSLDEKEHEVEPNEL